jgi:uncharacterized protein
MSATKQTLELGDGKFSHNQIAATLSRKIQQLIILPTERCNFRCTYCYEDFLIGKMKEAVQVSVERFMARRIPELRQLSIEWFGGEPLVAKDVVLRLSAYANRTCADHGVNFSGGMTTNAYLLDFALFEELLSYGQRSYQITLDGWDGGHNAVRRLANGKGTFDRIWQNLVAMRQSDQCFSIVIRVHVRRDNHESVELLVDNLAQTFGSDNRFTLDFEHLRNLGGEGGKSVDRPLSLAELREIEVGLRSRFNAAVAAAAATVSPAPEQIGPAVADSSHGEGGASSVPESAPYICYAAKPNSLLIRADGRIGKCTVALSDDRNTIGRINPDGTIAIDNALLRPWVRGLANLDESALACPLGGVMSGARISA